MLNHYLLLCTVITLLFLPLLKSTLLILLFWSIFPVVHAQTDPQKIQSSADSGGNSTIQQPPGPKRTFRNEDSAIRSKNDSMLSSITGVSVNAEKIADSSKAATAFPTSHPIDTIYLKLLNNPFFKTDKKPIYLIINGRTRESKDEKFYILSGILFLLSLIKLGFSRYFNNLFQQLFQPNYRQKQTREQLSQNNFPSLLLNLFSIVSGGAFIALLMQYYYLSTADFTINFAYSSIFLLGLYTGKYLLLTFAGWVFQTKEVTDSYLFTVFLINKILGIILLPFTFITAFSTSVIINYAIISALMIIVILFLYRFIAAKTAIRNEIKVSITHFIIYIVAFEIIPLLVIYKTLVIYLVKSA